MVHTAYKACSHCYLVLEAPATTPWQFSGKIQTHRCTHVLKKNVWAAVLFLLCVHFSISRKQTLHPFAVTKVNPTPEYPPPQTAEYLPD